MLVKILLLAFIVECFCEKTTNKSNGIPTTEEQADLLQNIQEIFEEVKLLVKDEGMATDEAVVADLKKIINRAQDKLSLVEELALIKLSCTCTGDSNDVCVLHAKSEIQKIIQDGEKILEKCVTDASGDIMQSLNKVSNMTQRATDKGQALLDLLNACSSKPTLQQIPCYKTIMSNDVLPVKLILLEAIKCHRDGHLKAITIMNEVNECIDEVMSKYQALVAQILADGLTCQKN